MKACYQPNVGEWLDMSDQNNGWWPIYEEADRRG